MLKINKVLYSYPEEIAQPPPRPSSKIKSSGSGIKTSNLICAGMSEMQLDFRLTDL